MSRPSVSRRFLGLTLAVTAAGGIGVGAWSAWGPDIVQPYRTAAADVTAPSTTPPSTTPPTTSPPSTAPAPAAIAAAAPGGIPATAGVTLDQAEAIATQASPGTVVKAKQDDDGPLVVFEVKIRHADGSDTKVEVDAASGRVVTVVDDQPEGNGPR
jgi:hypothetical protein